MRGVMNFRKCLFCQLSLGHCFVAFTNAIVARYAGNHGQSEEELPLNPIHIINLIVIHRQQVSWVISNTLGDGLRMNRHRKESSGRLISWPLPKHHSPRKSRPDQTESSRCERNNIRTLWSNPGKVSWNGRFLASSEQRQRRHPTVFRGTNQRKSPHFGI